MNDRDMERLFEQSLSGDPPRQAFRDRVLLASSTAFVLTRRRHARRRRTTLAVAAVLIAGVSFLGGRYSVARRSTETPPGAPPVATAATPADGTMVVSSDLVAWVYAARLFRQLGMEDRAGRALDYTGRLMPPDTAGPGAGQEKHAEETDLPDRRESLPLMNRLMAQSLGD